MTSPSVRLGPTPSAVVQASVRTNHVTLSSSLLFALVSPGDDDRSIIAVIGAFAGVYLFYRGFRLLQRKRMILDTPASKIRSAAMGLVEVSGLAVGPYTMAAPITGMPCYYFRTMAWQWQQRGKSNDWVKVADESLHVPFYLDDNTGRVLVDPQGAEMDIHRDFHEEFGSSVFSSSLEIPANITNFLMMHGVSTDKKIKIEEYCIKPKNSLFVLGTLSENPGLTVSAVPVRSLTSDQHTVSLRIPLSLGEMSSSAASTSGSMTFSGFKSDRAPQEVIRLADNSKPADAGTMTQQERISAALMKAGITNPAAWAAAGMSTAVAATPAIGPAAGSGAGAALATEQFDLHPPVVLMKGKHDPSFLISWHSQRDLVRSLSWKSALMIWGGPALTLLCAYILFLHFDWL